MLLKNKVKLILEDNSVFYGYSFGAESSVSGEVVFNTGMVGYPESLTDPSYKGQLLVLTYPLIGNYGIPNKERDKFGILKNFESERIQVQALIVSDYSWNYNHWNAEKSLSDWLKEENVPGIFGIDTRELTKKLREKGAMLGKIIFKDDIDFYDPNKADLVKQVTIKEPIIYNSNKNYYNIKNSIIKKTIKKENKKIILIDCGVKNNIIRSLLKRNVSVIRVPYDYDFFKLDFDGFENLGFSEPRKTEFFDGILISNGPGDPKICKKTISNVKKAMQKEIPVFGICLGNQILALAAGADTYKLKYGHRSQNQPCLLKGTKRCFITTQNHGFAVDIKSLDSEWQEWFVNVNDNTNEGIRHKTKPWFSIQFHPESTPGPVDTEFLFDEFLKKID